MCPHVSRLRSPSPRLCGERARQAASRTVRPLPARLQPSMTAASCRRSSRTTRIDMLSISLSAPARLTCPPAGGPHRLIALLSG